MSKDYADYVQRWVAPSGLTLIERAWWSYEFMKAQELSCLCEVPVLMKHSNFAPPLCLVCGCPTDTDEVVKRMVSIHLSGMPGRTKRVLKEGFFEKSPSVAGKPAVDFD